MLTWLLGWFWWLVLPVRKRLAVQNYRRVFPDRSPGELRRTVGDLVVSYLHLAIGRRIDVQGVEALKGGGILLAGHGLCWDLALVSLARQAEVTIFVKPPSNPTAARWIEKARVAARVELLPPSGSMQAAYDALERGRVVMFLLDQRHNKGIAVPFFGRPALTSPAFASMLWRTRAPLFVGWQWREGGRYQAMVEPVQWPIPDDREVAIPQLTARTQRYYEERIRQDPPNWLWLHDRWKRAPETCEDPLADPG